MDASGQFQAVARARHVHIREEDPHVASGVQLAERLIGIGRLEHLKAGVPQEVRFEDARERLILDQEDHRALT